MTGLSWRHRSWRYRYCFSGNWLALMVLLVTFHFLMLTVGIRKKSRVPGVMITQFIETLPEGKSHPDFTRKPIALTIQEGKCGSLNWILTSENFYETPETTVWWGHRYSMSFLCLEQRVEPLPKIVSKIFFRQICFFQSHCHWRPPANCNMEQE